MTWVVIAIASYIVFYTAINVGFRRDERPHEPAAEARERKRHFIQASMNGWTRYAVHLSTPTNATEIARAATIAREPAPADLARAVPLDLTLIFPGKPSMHPAPASLVAAATVPTNAELRVQLNFDPVAHPVAFGESLAYAKDNHLRIFVQDEARTALDETPLPAAPLVELALPPAVLAAGEWQATLYTKDAIFNWTFVVQ